MKIRRIKRVKKNEKSSSFRILLFSFCLIVYMPAIYHWFFEKGNEFEIIKYGSIEDSIKCDALIIRNESVLSSPIEGKSEEVVAEGDKVAADTSIVKVMSKGSATLLKKINNIDMEILKYKKEDNVSNNIISQDIINIESEITGKVKNIISINNSNNIEKIDDVRDEINSLIKKKIEVVNNTETVENPKISSLLVEREKIQSDLNKASFDLKTTDPGIVSYYIDNFEEEVNVSQIEKLNNKIFSKVSKDKGNRLTSDVEIKKDGKIAKVVKDHEYYFATIISEEESAKIEEKDYVNIRVIDIGGLIRGQIVKKYKSNGNIIIVIQVNKLLEETIAYRKVAIELGVKPYSGLKVNKKALVFDPNNKNVAKIMLLKLNCAKTIEVKVIESDQFNAIVENISNSKESLIKEYDEYVMDPSKIKEGQVIIR